MKKKSCHLEKEVIDCLKAEKLSPEIKKHIDECLICKDIAYAYGWISRFKKSSWNREMLEKPLPEHETIWNRAYAKQRPDKGLMRKALRPLIYPRVFSYPVLIIGIIFLFLKNMKEIQNIIDSSSVVGPVLDSLSKITPPLFLLFLAPMAIIFVSLLFCSLVVAFERLKKTA